MWLILLLVALLLLCICMLFTRRRTPHRSVKAEPLTLTAIQENNHLSYKANTNSYCLVTAFLDLKRNTWSGFQRGVDGYLGNFERLLSIGTPLVVYIDEALMDRVLQLVQTTRSKHPHVYVEVVPINRQFLQKNIYAWSLLEREKEIMASVAYQQLVGHRQVHPEHSIPEYNMVNHAKIDLVVYTMDVLHQPKPYDRYGWVDFGYCHNNSVVPRNPIQLSRLDGSCITMMTHAPLEQADGDPVYTLQSAPEKVAGGFFMGSRNVLHQYQAAYHKALQELHARGIADDDQALVAYMFYNVFDKIKFVNAGYRGALRYLCDGVERCG